MDENERRGGKMARAAAHILTALATTGVKGAAIAAAEEAASFLIKLAAGLPSLDIQRGFSERDWRRELPAVSAGL